MANNALLFNAALNGYVAGALAGAFQTSATATDYSGIVTEAKNWATEVDSLIATDTAGTPFPTGSTGISVAGGAAISPPGSSAVQEAQAQKSSLIEDLSYSQAFQRFTTGQVAADFAVPAAAVVAIYSETVPQSVTP